MRLLFAVVLFLLAGSVNAGLRQATAADVAKQFYEMANQGKCREAERLFTPESLQVIRRTLDSPDGFAAFCAGQGGKAPLAKLAVKEEKTTGDRARVVIERFYEDGSIARGRDDLVKADGQWLLSVGQNQLVAKPEK